jgi:hypothetical protein
MPVAEQSRCCTTSSPRVSKLRVRGSSSLGLNPHAGESAHLGREEIEVIVPVLETLRTQGLAPTGPLLERRRACCSTREYLVTILQTFRVSMIAD